MPVALDVETTGLNPEQDRIVQFCLVQLNPKLEVQQSIKATVNPGIPIPPEATAIHGIRDLDVHGLPFFSKYASWIQGLLQPEEVVIGYNGNFDLDFLHYELVRAGEAGIPITQPLVDPCRIFRENYPHTLQNAVYHYLAERFSDNHEAERDTMATVRVLEAQLKAHALTLEQAISIPAYDWVDRGRRFYKQEGQICFAFGMHKGKPALEHPDYLRWMLERGTFNGDTKQIALQLLAILERRNA